MIAVGVVVFVGVVVVVGAVVLVGVVVVVDVVVVFGDGLDVVLSLQATSRLVSSW